MTLLEFIRLVLRNIKILATVPLAMAVLVYYLTQDQPKEYMANTMIYTGLASGYTIESTGETRRDHKAIHNSFDNLINTMKARETLQEVSFRLLAQHLVLTRPDNPMIAEKAFQDLQELVSPAVRTQWVVKNEEEATFQNIQKAYNSGNSLIREIFHEKTPYYSIQALSDIKAMRKASSDMVDISYKTDDQGICKNTLEILLKVFIRKYKQLKVSETGSVVAYFEEQLDKAKQKLTKAEDKLKRFREKGRILNYYEQTKFIAAKKEDITDEYRRLIGDKNASQSVLKELERKLSVDKSFFFKNNEILAQKDQLSKLMTSIALQEAKSGSGSLHQLKQEAEELEASLQKSVLEVYSNTHSTEGLPIKSLLNEWLDNLIIGEKSKAKAEVLEGRLTDIDRQYDEFAPLGSGLARHEREINVHERAYIEILHGLNLALLRQRNIEMSSNLEIVDHPNTFELGSKRLVLVIMAFMAGFLGCLSVIVAIELLDTTIKSPQRAMQFTQMDFAGAYPLLGKRGRPEDSPNTEVLTNQIITHIKMSVATPVASLILLCSNQAREGKSILSHVITQKLRKTSKKVLQINPLNSSNVHNHPHDKEYMVDEKIFEVENIPQLLEDETLQVQDFNYIVLEIPPLLQGQIPLGILQKSDMVLLTLRANRSWNGADKYIVNNILQNSPFAPKIILNGVKGQHLENLLCETNHRKDSSFRKKMKRLIQFQFHHDKLKKL